MTRASEPGAARFRIGIDLGGTKIEALACYESQQCRPYSKEDYIRSWARSRGGQIFDDFAEAFDVLRWVLP